MDIDKFAHGNCDFCDYEKQSICLSCKKIILHEAIKAGIYEAFSNGQDYEEAIKQGICEGMPDMSYLKRDLIDSVRSIISGERI
jgi:hypothetical protein